MSTPATRESAPAPVVPAWSLADRLRKIRRDVLDIEQAEMARSLEVTRQAYAAWETGRSAPRDVVAIARRLELLSGVPASWTLGLDSPIPPSPTHEAPTLRQVPDSRDSIGESAQVATVVPFPPRRAGLDTPAFPEPRSA